MEARKAMIVQDFTEKHEIRDEAPAGGISKGLGFEIAWQDGPCGDGVAPNGAFTETIIRACIGRLEFFQGALKGKFACGHNQKAIRALHEAMGHLQRRQRDRLAAGILGTNTP